MVEHLTQTEFFDAVCNPMSISLAPAGKGTGYFSTGSRGYTVNGRFLINGKVYLGTMNLIEANSKPVAAVAPTMPATDLDNPSGVQPSARRTNAVRNATTPGAAGK